MAFSLRRSARLAATLGTGVLTVWTIASLDILGVTDFKNSDAAGPLENSKAPLSVESESVYAPHVIVDADTRTSVAANKVTEERDQSEAAATAFPLLDKDPAHVAPIDGQEYADHRKPKSVTRLLAKISHHTLMNPRDNR
jgi:hypothetical protein